MPGRGAGHDRRAFHEMIQAIIMPRKDAFRKQQQRSPGRRQQSDGIFQAFPVQAFPVDAEHAEARQEPGVEPALHEHMPARHDIEQAVHLSGQQADDKGVARPGMIGRQDDAVTRG